VYIYRSTYIVLFSTFGVSTINRVPTQ